VTELGGCQIAEEVRAVAWPWPQFVSMTPAGVSHDDNHLFHSRWVGGIAAFLFARVTGLTNHR